MSPSPQDLNALGWSLLHFVWQGAACALVLSVANVLLRRSAPQARYVTAFGVLLGMLILPFLTFRLVRASAGSALVETVVVSPVLPDGNMVATPSTAPSAAVVLGMRDRLEPWLPTLVGLWAVGVLLLSVRGVGGWMIVQRLRRTGLRAAPGAEETLQRLVAAMRVSAAVRLYESALVHVPTVVGWLRPVILLPASALTGLSPEQLELILAHELAHIRRRDYLVNLVQAGAETLLFYHPAVWWVSHRMRVEREHCCDDLATAAAGSPVRYARALADLEELCVPGRESQPAFVMAATSGSLLSRIARLLAPPREVSRAPRGLAAVVALGSLCLALGVGSSLVAIPQAGSPSVSAASLEFVANPVAEEQAAPDAAEPKTTPQADPAPPSSAKKGVSSPTPSHESRAFSIDRILAMARSGITPEYVDAMDAIGYSSLSADQLIALRSQGVGPEFVLELQEVGYASLSADQLMSLRSQGVSGRYAADLKALGYDKLSLTKLIALRSQGITREYVQGMADLGYRELDVAMLLGLRSQGVTPDFVRGLKEQGHDGLPAGMLIELRSQGVTPDYVRALKAAGLSAQKPEGLIHLRSQGVTADFIQGLKDLGYGGLDAPSLIELRSHGVTPDYVRELKAAGFDNLKVEELVELRNKGVRPGLLQRLRGRQ